MPRYKQAHNEKQKRQSLTTRVNDAREERRKTWRLTREVGQAVNPSRSGGEKNLKKNNAPHSKGKNAAKRSMFSGSRGICGREKRVPEKRGDRQQEKGYAIRDPSKKSGTEQLSGT